MGTQRKGHHEMAQPGTPIPDTEAQEFAAALRDDAAEDLAAIMEDWGAIHSDFDQIRMDADFEF